MYTLYTIAIYANSDIYIDFLCFPLYTVEVICMPLIRIFLSKKAFILPAPKHPMRYFKCFFHCSDGNTKQTPQSQTHFMWHITLYQQSTINVPHVSLCNFLVGTYIIVHEKIISKWPCIPLPCSYLPMYIGKQWHRKTKYIILDLVT